MEESEEKLDVVDNEGRPTGKVLKKSYVHTHQILHNCGDVWVVNDKNQVLIQQRSKNKIANPLCWDISASGHVSAGETVEQGTARELFEEIGIKAKTEDLIFVDKIITFAKLPEVNQDRKHFINVFLYKYKGEKLKLEPMEVDSVEWVNLDDFENELTKRKFVKNKIQLYKAVLPKIKRLL